MYQLMPKPKVGVRLNTSHPMANGLVGCWLMNEGSGNIVYDNTAGNGAVFYGTPQWVPQGIELNGTDAGMDLDCSYLDSAGLSHFTVITKVKFIAQGGNDELLSKDFKPFKVKAHSESGGYWRYYFSFYNGSDFFQPLSSYVFKDGETYTIAIRYDGSTIKGFYNDGIEIATKATTGTPDINSSTQFFVGNSRSNQSYWMNALYYYVNVYSRALTAAEIAAIHSNPYAMFEPEPIFLLAQSAAAGGISIPVAMYHRMNN